MSDWYTYIIRCADNSLYAGIAKDLDRRINEHNHDNQLGAKYTRPRRPVKLVYQQSYASRSQATQREMQIKRMSKQEKENLIKGGALSPAEKNNN